MYAGAFYWIVTAGIATVTIIAATAIITAVSTGIVPIVSATVVATVIISTVVAAIVSITVVAAIVVPARSNFSIVILPKLKILHTRAEQNRQHSDNFSKKTQSPVHYKKLNEKLKQFSTMKKQSFS